MKSELDPRLFIFLPSMPPLPIIIACVPMLNGNRKKKKKKRNHSIAFLSENKRQVFTCSQVHKVGIDQVSTSFFFQGTECGQKKHTEGTL